MTLFDQIVSRTQRDSTGLLGLKAFAVNSNGLGSPAMCTPWPGPLLTADNWSNSAALRGEAGIHACWPWSPDDMMSYLVHENSCIAEVRGYGDTIQGETGWRSQYCLLQVVHCFPHQLADLTCSPDGTLDGWYSEVPILCDQFNVLHLLAEQLEGYQRKQVKSAIGRLERRIKRLKL